ncbi:MAG TPA: pseudouridine synthase [Clostridiales bacterium]|nr:pseudouridine synthase [Clostridiales bacterium]
MRLQKYMASCGVASRRKSEELISQGRVTVNDTVIMEPGTKVSPGDVVAVDGKVIRLQQNKIYIMLNKPAGYITTVSDDRNRKTVMDLVKDAGERLYPVGRLDKDTQGLLLFTNDGDFHLHMTHPSNEVDKEYVASIDGRITQDTVLKFQKGFLMEGSVTAPSAISEICFQDRSSDVRIIIHEGKKRQVKRMLAECGFKTLALKRIRIDRIVLGDLPMGQWRHLTEKELHSTGFCKKEN